MATLANVNLGIDVAATHLDVAVQPSGKAWALPRSRGGLRRLQARVQAQRNYVELAGQRVNEAKRRIVELLEESGKLYAEPRAITQAVTAVSPFKCSSNQARVRSSTSRRLGSDQLPGQWPSPL